MRKIKVAQIGTSRFSHGADIFECMRSLPDIFEIVGYALPENEREKFPERMGVFDGYCEMTVDEILSDPQIEAVTIETEEKYLTKYAISATKAGKHIHMEKPGSGNHKEFKELIDIAKANNTILHIGYMYRYNPYIRSLINRVKNGELGDIICVEAQMNTPHQPNLRQWLNEVPGGIMFFLGCHMIDLILQLQGKPLSITPFNKRSGVGGIDSGDFGMAVFEYENGVSFAKSCSIEYGGFTRRQLVVTGTKGTIEVRPLEYYVKYPGLQTGYREVSDYDWVDNTDFRMTDKFRRYDDMMISFARNIAEGRMNPADYDYELKLHECILKASGIDTEELENHIEK